MLVLSLLFKSAIIIAASCEGSAVTEAFDIADAIVLILSPDGFTSVCMFSTFLFPDSS